MKSALALLVLALAAPLRAEPVEDLLPGARAQGMGQAYIGSARGADGLLYNPAAAAGLPDLDTSVSLLRQLGTSGPYSGFYLAWARPVDWTTGGGGAFSAYLQRHPGDVDRDSFNASYGGIADLQQVANSAFGLKLPPFVAASRWGASARVVSIRNSSGTTLTLGADAGLLLEGPHGLHWGLALTDFMLDSNGRPGPALGLGAAYDLRPWALVACDLRWRGSVLILTPGAEFKLFSDLLRLRAGRGVSWDGHSQLALGMGVDFSPYKLDAAVNIPFAGWTERAGGYQITASYRFGAVPYYGKVFGEATQAEAHLVNEVGRLTDQKTLLERDIKASKDAKQELDSQIKAARTQLEDLHKRAEDYGKKVAEPPANAPAKPTPKPKPAWPKRHVVAEGDTLRSIAAQYYNDPLMDDLIYKANPDKVERGLPRLGAELVLPDPAKAER